MDDRALCNVTRNTLLSKQDAIGTNLEESRIVFAHKSGIYQTATEQLSSDEAGCLSIEHFSAS